MGWPRKQQDSIDHRWRHTGQARLADAAHRRAALDDADMHARHAVGQQDWVDIPSRMGEQPDGGPDAHRLYIKKQRHGDRAGSSSLRRSVRSYH
jgi:hypothetical protein